MSRYDVVVAGGGAAGLSAAIFLARANVGVAVFDRAESSLRRVEKVYNYLGFPDGVGGTELLVLGRRQAERFGATVHDAIVDTVVPTGDGFDVTASDDAHRCQYFILASNKRTDLATALGIELGGFGGRFVHTAEDGATAVDRCYAVGRITGRPSQAIISAGDGARVA
ncbi:MAG TPA: FAD-binding protein, partial [Candidatus Eremiobacteraceae bacterium]|nr:FAD-binding protein [Candidatus Eremiobacteraceae bacterium]